MKYLITDSGTQYGPFRAVAPVDGGWSCDGIMYPEAVIGAATINGAPCDNYPTEPTTSADIDALAAQYEPQLQNWLDRTAQAFGFDSMATAVTYADEPAVPLFQAKGAALRAWRSHLWLAGRKMVSEVRAGARPVPTEAEVLDGMPAPPDLADFPDGDDQS